jgi:hypothetical protein
MYAADCWVEKIMTTRAPRSGMNTDELKVFVRLETQMGEIQKKLDSIEECLEGMPAILTRLDVNYTNLKEEVDREIGRLEKKSDSRDTFAYMLSIVAAVVGSVFGSK